MNLLPTFKTERYRKAHKNRQRYRLALICLAVLVASATGYALIHPAITMTAAAHRHDASCYTQVTSSLEQALHCTFAQEHADDTACIVHLHDQTCYDDTGALVCTLVEVEAHTHTEACHTVPEAHTHSEDCYERQQGDLICGEEETEEHQHTDNPYVWADILVCGLDESAPAEPVLICEKPEIVLHLAAQPIVRDSYKDPVYTYETNVMGTVNILECVRLNPCVKSFLNVTTDKVYENREWEYGYREVDRLDGYDPYSNSKSCSELVTHSYKKSFFADGHCAISTCRAGNVIGGGDFANDRIVPDCVRAAMAKKPIIVRNPHSTRPYQHVLEPLAAYLMVAKAQYEDGKYAGYYNVGPDDKDCVTTGELVDMFCNAWGNGLSWENKSDGGPHEANFLKLDCSKLKTTFGWHPRYGVKEAIGLTVEWCQEYEKNGDVVAVMDRQIAEMFQ